MYHHTSPTPGVVLVLLALVALSAAADVSLDGAAYACTSASYPTLPDSEGVCASQTTKADCLSIGFSFIADRYSCSWRAITSTVLVDEFYIWNKEENSESSYNASIQSSNAFFPNFCAMESTITVPKSAAGNYYVTNNIIYRGPVTAESTCMTALAGGKNECAASLGFPPTMSFGDTISLNMGFFNPVSIPENTTILPTLMKNTYYLPGSAQCGGVARRRLAQDASTRPWFQGMSFGQVVLGGPNTIRYPSFSSTSLVSIPTGFASGQLSGIVSVIAKVRLVDNPVAVRARPGTAAPTPVVHGYLINPDTFYTYLKTDCATSCAAPTSLAIASCTVDAKGKCEFEVTGLDGSSRQLMIVSKGTLGVNPSDPLVPVRLTLDVQYHPQWDAR